MTNADRFDVIVVGARCAGSPLAALLARQGVSVALVEQATFPRDTLSSHIFESDALAFLDRLGVSGELRRTGAPFAGRGDIRADDMRVLVDWPQRPGDIGGLASIRRLLLDPILARAAEEAGTEVRFATKVTGLLEQHGRVAGVRVSGDAGETDLHARLVVGADGRNSTVARLAGSRKYNLTPNQRALYWTFFEGADVSQPTFVTHRWNDRFILGIPSDSGLYHVLVWPEFTELARFRRDLEAGFMEQARSCEPVEDAVASARRIGKFFGAVRWVGFFREPSGPGWVLTGDAGHFKDPAPGRGIGDAFIQADTLAPAIVAGLGGPDDALDRAMARWGRWRDDEFAEHYWMAVDLGKAGVLPAVLPEILRGLHRRGKLDLFLDLLNHRGKPSGVLTPPRLIAATGRVLARRGSNRRQVLQEVRTLVADDMRRRWRGRRPDFAAGPATDDAGPTEVDSSPPTTVSLTSGLADA
jgi:flavin-dependent dehydrogenase